MSSVHDVGYAGKNANAQNLNETVTFHKPNFASFPTAATFPVNAFMMDDSTGDIYKNVSGTWTRVTNNITASASFPTSPSLGLIFFHLSLLFHYYCKSINPVRFNRLYDNLLGCFKDTMTSYADQTAFDAAYPSSDTTKMRGNPTNDNIDFNVAASDASNDSIVYDFGSGVVDSTKWTLRFKLRFSSLANDNYMHIGMSGSDQSVGSGSVQHWIGMYIYRVSVGAGYYTRDTDTTAPNATTAGQQFQALDWATGIDYFFEISRISATQFKIKRYSDSTYSTVLEEKTDTVGSGVSVRYFKIMNNNTSHAGNIVGTIDDVEFYNGI